MLAPTFIAALAWFSMNLVMLAAPFSMINCGVAASGVMGAVACLASDDARWVTGQVLDATGGTQL